jgi:hypothetical protein
MLNGIFLLKSRISNPQSAIENSALCGAEVLKLCGPEALKRLPAASCLFLCPLQRTTDHGQLTKVPLTSDL